MRSPPGARAGDDELATLEDDRGALQRTRRIRWWIVAVPGLLYFFSYFHRVAPAVVAEDLMRTFAVSAAALGNLAAIYPYCFAAMALPGGSLADTLGPRRTLALGSLTMAAGAFLFGLAPTFGAAFAGRLLVGLGASVILISSLRLASEWFRTDEFATVSGLSQAVGSFGALVGTTPLAVLADGLGWRATFVGIGAITLALSAACFLLVRDRPEAFRLVPVNPVRPGPPPGLRAVLAGIPAVARNRYTWGPVLASTGLYGAFVSFVGLWGVPYLSQVHGLSRVEAANLVALAPAGLLAGAPLVGWISDRWLRLRRPPLIAASAVSVVAWVGIVAPPVPLPPAWTGLLCLLLGLGSGASALVFACVRELNDPRYVGIALGFQNLPVFLGFALMQWLTGLVLDARWAGALEAGTRLYPFEAYRAAFALCLGVALASFLATLLVKETHCRNIWRTPGGSPEAP